MVAGLDYSPITGGEGNIEFLAYLVTGTTPKMVDYSEEVQAVVAAAHAKLKR